jgi:hypothetical protein
MDEYADEQYLQPIAYQKVSEFEKFQFLRILPET